MRHCIVCLLPVFALMACASDSDPTLSPAAAAPDATVTPPDNTYVADFDVGDLSFKRVWVPDVGQSGFDFNVWFDLITKVPKSKVYVSVDFVRLDTGNASDLNVKAVDFSTEYPKIPVGAFVIDQIDPDSPVHVDQTFTLPTTLADGKYAAILGINQLDMFPDVNAQQGEVAEDNPARVLVAPATVIVGKPTKPNLRVLTSTLTENYFTQPVIDLAAPSAVAQRHIQVNLEVDSMAKDCTKDVELAFALSIGGHEYPLKIGTTAQGPDSTATGTTLSLLDRWTYKAGDVVLPTIPAAGIDPADEVDPTEEPLHTTEPIAIATQLPIGRTFDLYLPDEAWASLTADATGDVIITLDPDNKIDEWGDTLAEQKGDNVKRHSVQYLVAAPTETTTTKSVCHGFYNQTQQYGTVITDMNKSDSFGNDKFGVGYGLRGVMSGGNTSVKFGTYNYVNGTVLGAKFTALSANAELDSDADCGSYYGYQVDVFGIRLFADGETFDAGEAKTLWEGDYKKSKEFETSKTFMVGIVPIEVSAGLTGTIGVVPKVSVGPLLRLNGEIAPYAELRGTAEGGVNLLVAKAGVGAELLVVKLVATNKLWVELPFKTAAYAANPPYTALTINYALPLEISTMDGRLYLWAKYLKWKNWAFRWQSAEYDIVNWSGPSWKYDLVPTKTKTFSLVSQ